MLTGETVERSSSTLFEQKNKPPQPPPPTSLNPPPQPSNFPPPPTRASKPKPIHSSVELREKFNPVTPAAASEVFQHPPPPSTTGYRAPLEKQGLVRPMAPVDPLPVVPPARTPGQAVHPPYQSAGVRK